MRKLTPLRFILAAALACGISAPAMAQFAFGGDAPIAVDADRAEYKGQLTILTGQVQVVQEDVRILSDRMDLYRADLGGGRLGDVTRIDATGNFYYITPQEEVRGEKGVYEQDKDRITVTGNVVLKDSEGNLASADRLVYDLTTKEAFLDGNCKGRQCPDGRIKILIPNGNTDQ